jgi:hypothetical protein
MHLRNIEAPACRSVACALGRVWGAVQACRQPRIANPPCPGLRRFICGARPDGVEGRRKRLASGEGELDGISHVKTMVTSLGR